MIGIFDSGSGGLSVFAALKARCPKVDVVYFGDIAHAPYGTRSAAELVELTKAGVSRLASMGATEIVSACNSVSPAVLAGAAGNLPAIEMTRPTATAMRGYADERVLLLATPATVNSGIYQEALKHVVLDVLAIPELAGAIEFAVPDEEISRIIREALVKRAGAKYDAVLLGCTHYPLSRNIIERDAGSAFGNVEYIDPAIFVAEAVAKNFDCSGKGTTRFVISKESPQFRSRVAALLPQDRYSIVVQ